MINKIAVVGLGSIGRRHLRILREIRPEIKIVAVRSGKNKKIPEENIANEVVYNLNDAIKSDIQAAIISTPASYHLDQATDLINAGINLLIEKPLSSKIS